MLPNFLPSASALRPESSSRRPTVRRRVEHPPDDAGQALVVASPEGPVRHQPLCAVAHVDDEGAESPHVSADGVSPVVRNKNSPFLDHL